MRKNTLFLLLLSVLTLPLLLVACGGGGEKQFADRGRYIYDDAERIPEETEVSLAGYLWKLDSKTDYELVLVFPKEAMDENGIIELFNQHGVGKKDKDTGAAIFVLPDNRVFTAIGSGNDKISVTLAKTQGERIFADFEKDPMLTLLRFSSALGGKLDESTQTKVPEKFFTTLVDNLALVLLWTSVIALALFLIQQWDRFQWHDLILPIAVYLMLGLFFGISAAASSGNANSSYSTYGVITETKHGSYHWTHTHTFCTSTGKTTTCHSIPHGHTMYTNDVNFLSYDLQGYSYRFATDESKAAWKHDVGELSKLSMSGDGKTVRDASGIEDNSGGKTIGDGVWIDAAIKR